MMQLVTKIRYKNKIVNIPEYIKSELQNLYNFNTENIIKTMDYGIPQMRKRLITIFTRNKNGIMFLKNKGTQNFQLFNIISTIVLVSSLNNTTN